MAAFSLGFWTLERDRWKVKTDVFANPLYLTIAILAVVCVILLLMVGYYRRKVDALAIQVEDELSRQRSLSSTYGRITEQCLTVLKMHLTEPCRGRI